MRMARRICWPFNTTSSMSSSVTERGNSDSLPAISVGFNATDLSVGDLNGDGRPDVAVSNGGSNSISILMGTASGVFLSKGKYGVGHEPRGIVIARFDGDSYPDVAVITFDSVAILLSNGTGAFRSIEIFPVGSNLGAPRSPAVADFSGDGNMDIAVLVGPGFSGRPPILR